MSVLLLKTGLILVMGNTGLVRDAGGFPHFLAAIAVREWVRRRQDCSLLHRPDGLEHDFYGAILEFSNVHVVTSRFLL
jgi:hypothetical protein